MMHRERGKNRIHHHLGAHPLGGDFPSEVSFSLWAPNAQSVHVVGTFNAWDGTHHPLEFDAQTGVWGAIISSVQIGDLYKYEILGADGQRRLKSDPIAFQCELRPADASVIVRRDDYAFGDDEWIASRAANVWKQRPLAVYEVHLGSWRRRGEHRPSYRDLAPELAAYCLDYGFTHIELLPIMEHPYDPSWGYQCTGYFAPTARFGPADDLKFFVDFFHQQGLGVILDWVPAHFPRNESALARFDGTCLYEPRDPRESDHPDWGTLIFNYARDGVRQFLHSSAVYWLEDFHVDGLRFDAVASMLYRDYSRLPGQWIPNIHGGPQNLEAVSLLQEINTDIHENFPGVLTIAEESSGWPGVTGRVSEGGLGFDLKWNMGWMNDTLRYFDMAPKLRPKSHNTLTHSMLYAWSENFVLPLSHDEVVHEKRSLFEKMPGSLPEQALQMRLLVYYLYLYPGKKLLFMGGEFGQRSEWDFDGELSWQTAQLPLHRDIHRAVKYLGRLYLDQPALWFWDHDERGFEWIDYGAEQGAHSVFFRHGPDSSLLCLFNFTRERNPRYSLGLRSPVGLRLVARSDGFATQVGDDRLSYRSRFDPEHTSVDGLPYSLTVESPPFSALVFERLTEL